MNIEQPGFWLRLMWAFRYFFLVLTSAEFARQVAVLDQQRRIGTEGAPAAAEEERIKETEKAKVPAEPVVPAADPEQPVLQLLGLLQQEARLIDFLQEDVTHYGDADIGAAARIVHSGCRKVLRQYMELAPIMQEAEQSRVTVPAGFDATEIRLTGRISGEGPFTGTLIHRGWKVTRIELPRMSPGHNARVLAPAELEV